ncbi:MAG: hypothetical protein K2G36_00045 [Ruminococcus sp.]|nr:hypothetical protein [Ruminococcus sp.]
MKKIISLIFTITILFGIFPVNTYAVDILPESPAYVTEENIMTSESIYSEVGAETSTENIIENTSESVLPESPEKSDKKSDNFMNVIIKILIFFVGIICGSVITFLVLVVINQMFQINFNKTDGESEKNLESVRETKSELNKISDILKDKITRNVRYEEETINNLMDRINELELMIHNQNNR